MDISSVVFGVLLGAFVAAVFTPAPTSDLYEVDVRQLAEAWAGARISPGDPYELKQAELKELVQSLARKYPELSCHAGLPRLPAPSGSRGGE